MLARPLFVACLIGTTLSISATGTVSLELVAATTVAWSGVVLIQLAAALAIIVGAPNRTLPVSDAVDAFFARHVPWSLWFLAYGAWAWIVPPAARHGDWILWTALVPAVWSAFLIYDFCRRILREAHRNALARTCVHQTIVWGAFLVVGGTAAGLWPRVLRALGVS